MGIPPQPLHRCVKESPIADPRPLSPLGLLGKVGPPRYGLKAGTRFMGTGRRRARSILAIAVVIPGPRILTIQPNGVSR